VTHTAEEHQTQLAMVAAGLGIAVGNASASLKNAADYISTAQRSQAICEIIDKYFK